MSTPSTPISKSAPAPSSSTPQTGTWRHPKLDEIVKRRDASNFSNRNVKKIIWNIGGLFGSWAVGKALWKFLPGFLPHDNNIYEYSSYGYYFCQVMFLFNIFVAFLPLFRKPDEINDIPLTPAQRKLLGLPPTSAPPTPGSSYVTPPRYARTPTPLGSSPGNREQYSESPLSRMGSPAAGSVSGSPYSPVSSPLLQKAVGGGFNGSRRQSYGSASPLGLGVSRGSTFEAPSTPTPAGSKSSNVTLNSKWLYDKGRRNSGNVKLF